MANKHADIELIERHCGKLNSDVRDGWEAGLKGKTRIGKRLYDRYPPEHLMEDKNIERFKDWILGRDRAIQYRSRLDKSVVFGGKKPDGEHVTIHRKGWSVKRGSVVNAMARKGCSGTVYVDYWENGKLVKTVNCGI